METRRARFAFGVGLLCLLGACGGSSDAPPPAFPHTLTEVSPLEGTTAGGTAVTLVGTGFRTIEPLIVQVRFGEYAAEEVVVVDDNTITCLSPPGHVGSVAVVIEGNVQTGILLTGGFRYVASLLWVGDDAQAAAPSLWQVDLDAKRTALVGPMGYGVTCLARSPDGRLFGVEDGAPHRLLVLDTVLGTASPAALLTDASTGDPLPLADITFVGGRLLGRTTAGLVGEVDPVLGTVTFLPASPPASTGPGMAASPEGHLHLTPLQRGLPLLLFDPVGGSATPGAPLDFDDPARLATLARDGEFLYAVAIDPAALAAPVLVRIHPTLGWSASVAILPPDARAVARVR